MAFFAPIPLIRKNHIIARLQETGAFSAETSKTLAEAGVINPNGFKRITERCGRRGARKKRFSGIIRGNEKIDPGGPTWQ